jgi:hypothetical protein
MTVDFRTEIPELLEYIRSRVESQANRAAKAPPQYRDRHLVPRAKRCEFGVENLEGFFGWPSYDDHGKDNLLKLHWRTRAESAGLRSRLIVQLRVCQIGKSRSRMC